MTKVNIRTGVWAGFAGEVVEAGEKSSRLEISVFGRKTIVELPNESFSAPGEPFDPFESFAEEIRRDQRWGAGIAARDWWLERENELTAATWEEHLERQKAVEAEVADETERLVARLREGVSDEPDRAEIDAYFREHEELFRPFLFQWRKSHENALTTETRREQERAPRAAELPRAAYRAWWAVQPRPAASCKDFLASVWSGDDFRAMGKAEYEAFDRWGREAVELILNRYRDEPLRVVELDALPEGHHWREWNELDPGAAVRRGFEALGERAGTLVDALAHHARAIYVIGRQDEYYLVYACDAEEDRRGRRTPYLSLVVGGPPLDHRELDAIDERLPEHTRSCGWSVPEELRAIYRVHHGLGRLDGFAWRFDNCGTIYPADQLGVVGEIMNEIAEEQNFEPDGYRFDDLLTFFEDGAGNGENFFRRGPHEQPIGTVDWDHETREISSVRTFWEFLQGPAMRYWFGDR